MACEIIDVKIEGRNLNGAGVPGTYAVTARVLDCKSLEILVTTPGGALVFHDPAFDVSSAPVDTAGYSIVDVEFTLAEPVPCGADLHVRLTCHSDPACQFDGMLKVECVECPSEISIQVEGSAGPVDPVASCLPPGDYTVTVLHPVGPLVTYDWTVTTPATGTTLSTTTTPVLTVTLPPAAAHGAVSVFVVARVQECPALASGFIFPASNAGPCPEDLEIIVRKDGVTLTAPYDNLAPGDVEVVVSEPLGATGYAFTEGSGAADQDGPAATYTATLAAGQALTVLVSVDNGPCCPDLNGFVELTAAAEDDDDDTDTDTGDGDGDGDDTTPDDDNGNERDPWTFNPCGVLAAIAIGALLLALVLVLLFFCGLSIGLVAIAVALGAAAIAFALLVALCRWRRCRLLAAITWCFMWGLIIGVIIAAFCLSLIVLIVAIGYAVIAGLMVLWLRRLGCPVPQPFRAP